MTEEEIAELTARAVELARASMAMLEEADRGRD